MARPSFKKVLLILMAAVSMFLLSGCSFTEMMSWGTGIKEDPDYQTWEKLSENGKLNNEGKYTADAVHLTFADSSFFEMEYFRDAEMKEKLPDENCYLLPGDLIYCTVKVKGEAANYYAFDHLDVIEYSNDNIRGAKLDWKYQNNGTALLIPFDYKGTEVAVEPVGRYRMITVALEQPEIGGVVRYTVNGQELNGETAELYRGAKVKGELEPDTGWESQLNNNPVYTVTEEENQVVTFEGKRANQFFTEADTHKPAVKLEMNRNLRTSRLTVEADGLKKKDCTAGNGSIVFEDEKIGTGHGIRVSFSHFDLEEGKNAIRLIVQKKTDNTEYKEIYYANETNQAIQIDFEYEVVYTAVNMTAEAVQVMEFTPVTDENADIIATWNDLALDNKEKNIQLAAGDMGTGDRQIKVQIIPHEKFKMNGANTENDCYSRNMRLDEYNRFTQEALQNQLKKNCILYLDTSDPYGEVKFRVNGQETSGEIVIEEGQSFVISYTLNDEQKDKYEIAEERNIFDQINVFDSERWTKYEKVINVTREMDGQTINREACIKLKVKEESK